MLLLEKKERACTIYRSSGFAIVLQKVLGGVGGSSGRTDRSQMQFKYSDGRILIEASGCKAHL